jgi:hypothetical protein
VVATRSQGFYFFEDKLAGYEFVSTWKDDLTDFDGAKVADIKNGSSTRAEVIRLIGTPGASRQPLPASGVDLARQRPASRIARASARLPS